MTRNNPRKVRSMQLHKRAIGYTTVFILATFLVTGAYVSVAQSQAAVNPPPSTNPTAGTPPAASDAKAPRSADVNPGTYVIGPEDNLSINVWKEQELSKTVPVRPDGMISLPLIGEVKASGLTPLQLQDAITEPLKKYMSEPQVTVIVTEVRSKTFNIVGQVAKPGYYPLDRQLTVLDSVALAGGFRDFAKVKKIYVLRTDASGKQERLPFNYKEVIKGENMQQNVELQPHDTVVVP